jgi:hypothetical protein
MKKAIAKWLRTYYPNTPFLRKTLTKIKLRMIAHYTMTAEDIQKGESDLKEKHRIVNKYAKKWPTLTRKMYENTKKYMQKNATLSANCSEEIQEDVLFNCFAYGFMPDEYFIYSLGNKTSDEKKAYISDKDRYEYSFLLNDFIDVGIFSDKYRAYEKYKALYKRDAVCIEREADFGRFCAFIQKHPRFVKKEVGLSCGDSVALICLDQTQMSEKEVFHSLIAKGRHILEEPVVQSAEMAKFHKESVNTVRCATFRTSLGIEIGFCFLKTGQGDSFVDNGGAGGILIGLSKETGIIETDGRDEFSKVYQQHPDTHVTFMGQQLPAWDEMISLAKKASAMTPSVRYISWDFAHTDAGWVVIEGNPCGQFIGPQIAWQRGIKKDIVSQIESVASISL